MNMRGNRRSQKKFSMMLVLVIAVGVRAPTPQPEATPTEALEGELFKNILREQKAIWLSFFKQKTAYEISTRDWSSDVCSSDLGIARATSETPPGMPKYGELT